MYKKYSCDKDTANSVAETMQQVTNYNMQIVRISGIYSIRKIRNNAGISYYTYPIKIKSNSGEAFIFYSLFLNYPVSFNQIINTKFRFLIPVTIMVNRNAINYTSGVYYYKFFVRQAGSSTGEFVETRKMILIK